MKEEVVGVVVETTVKVNNDEYVRFITFPLPDETTQIVQVGDLGPTRILIAFLLLLCSSKLMNNAERKVAEGLLRRLDDQIARSEGDMPFGFRPDLN